MNFFQSIFARRSQSKARIDKLAVMPSAIYAVGDVHGCLESYLSLEAKILTHAQSFSGDKLILLMGDVIDRGPKSAQMLSYLCEMPPAGIERRMLLGNHEHMFMKFLKSPKSMRQWLSFGGAETLSSYGIRPDPKNGFELPDQIMLEILKAYIPDEHIKLLKESPHGILVSNLFFSHAGFDPERPLFNQNSRDLLFGRPSRVDAYKDLPRLIHGHVPDEEVYISKNRIGTDLGCYGTGKLAAVCLQPDGDLTSIKVENGSTLDTGKNSR